MEIAQKEKSALLQRAVLNSSVEELAKIYDELGFVEMSAPALGLACRFRGLAAVELLVQKGASFDFPLTKEAMETYNCYIGTKKHGDFRTNYAMYLLRAFGKRLPVYGLTGMTMEQHAAREDGSLLPFLTDGERVSVMRYLLENRDRIAFYPEELLYYAIFYRDTALVKELKMQNVKISEQRVQVIADGASAPNGYWYEYVCLTRQLDDEDYLAVMQQLVSEIDGKLFHYTEGIFDALKRRFCDGRIFEFFYAHFKREKMNKRAILCGLIDEEAMEAFPVVEREGWLAMPKRRDEMIAYASQKGKTEALAWLLAYKNRTADLAAEQEKAEKRLVRELNRAPDSVDALKKLWHYQKREDGTLFITNYKGTDTEVTVPEKIGRSIVTAVGNGAFAGGYCDENPKITSGQMEQHRGIVKIILPGTLRYLGSAFYREQGLEEVYIPDGVEVIGNYAFYECVSFRNITIPDKVKRIGQGAFEGCGLLKCITIPEQVKKIGMNAFKGCSLLEQITIPEGLEEIGTGIFRDCCSLKNVAIPGTVEKISAQAFFGCNHLAKVKIREGVRGIGQCAFMGCYSLTDITIPNTVEEIGAYAFDRCRKLEDMRIGDNVKEIGEFAFRNCSALKDIRLPKTVEKIGRYAFSDCQGLEKLCISEGVKEIGESVFNNCTALKNITIPEAARKVGACAFQGCTGLKSITIPKAVEEIGKGAFTGCSSLEEVCICGEVKKFGTGAFSGCQSLKVIKIMQAIPNRILGEAYGQCGGMIVSCPKGSKTEAYCKKKGIPFEFF